MKKIFLTSSFADVATLFLSFANEELVNKTVTFIPTASIPEEINFYVKAAKDQFEEFGMIVDELEISTASKEEIELKLAKNEYLYLSGGNSFFLLQELIKSGADHLIQKAVFEGKTYIGESAGAIVASPNIEYSKEMDDCSKASGLKTFEGLKLVDFYTVPHDDCFPFEEATKKIKSLYQNKLALYPITNEQALFVCGEQVVVKEVAMES